MTKNVETVLAWGLFAAVYVLILAIIVAPDLFSAGRAPGPVVTVAQADLSAALARGDLTPRWAPTDQTEVAVGNPIDFQPALLAKPAQ